MSIIDALYAAERSGILKENPESPDKNPLYLKHKNVLDKIFSNIFKAATDKKAFIDFEDFDDFLYDHDDNKYHVGILYRTFDNLKTLNKELPQDDRIFESLQHMYHVYIDTIIDATKEICLFLESRNFKTNFDFNILDQDSIYFNLSVSWSHVSK